MHDLPALTMKREGDTSIFATGHLHIAPAQAYQLVGSPAGVECYSQDSIVAQACQRVPIDAREALLYRLRINRQGLRIRLYRPFLDALNGVGNVQLIDLLHKRVEAGEDG